VNCPKRLTSSYAAGRSLQTPGPEFKLHPSNPCARLARLDGMK